MPKKPPTVTQAETIAALLERSKRAEVPIRKTFVQQGKGKVRIPGPLTALVSNHDERALDLYLLAHAPASADPFDVVLPETTWARALGLSVTASARSAVSKAFRRLEGPVAAELVVTGHPKPGEFLQRLGATLPKAARYLVELLT